MSSTAPLESPSIGANATRGLASATVGSRRATPIARDSTLIASHEYTRSTLAIPLQPLSAPDVDPVDRRNLRITGKHKAVTGSHVAVQAAAPSAPTDDVVVIVTQAYGPQGHNLVGISDVQFDGHPAVTVGLRAGDREGLVHLSPIHGDGRKQGLTDLPQGTRCELFCPVSGQALDLVGEVEDGSG